MAELSLRGLKKPTLKLELENGKVLNINPPKNSLLRKFQGFNNASSDEVFEVMAEALSSNKEGYTISKEKAEELFDIYDLMEIFKAYTEFVKEVQNLKN